MPDFGWSYPPGCNSVPDDEPYDDSCLACHKPESDWNMDEYEKLQAELDNTLGSRVDRRVDSLCSRQCWKKWTDPDAVHDFKELMDKLDAWGYSYQDGVVTKQETSPDLWESQISSWVFKNTECGAWSKFLHDPDGVKVGSIVEGADAEAEPIDLYFPFTYDNFINTLDKIEAQAREIWDETHGCEQCDADGFDGAVNPNCPACHGEGTVI